MSDEPHIGQTMQINLKTGEFTIKPDAQFQVWFEPTENGKKTFGWKAEPIGNPLLNEEDAMFECYLHRLEEPAPDFSLYGRYVVREVKP